MSNDSDPKFTAEFYLNLKLLSQDLYKKSSGQPSSFQSQQLAVSSPRDRRRNSSTSLVMAPAMVAGGGSATASPRHDTTPVSSVSTANTLQDRLKLYAKSGNIPSSFLDRYLQENKSKEPTGGDADLKS